MNKKFEKLKKENEKIREEIDKIMDIPKLTTTKKYFKASIWEKINELVNNEIEQESMCNI